MSATIPGRRTFLAGCIVLLLFGAVHFTAVIKSNFFDTPTPDETRMAEALKARTILEAGPFHATMWNAVQILSSSYSFLLFQTGVLSLIALRPAIAAGRLRALTLVNALFAAIYAGVCLYNQFPPPLTFATIACILFVVSFVSQGRQSEQKTFPVVRPGAKS